MGVGIAYVISIKSLRVTRIIRWLAAAITVFFAITVICGRIYVSRAASVSDAEIAANPSKAITDLSQALRVDPISSSTYFKRGIAYRKSDDPQHAYSDLQKAVSLSPGNIEARTEFAKAALDVGNLNEALTALKRITEGDPTNFDALNEKGIVEILMGNNIASIKDFEAALVVADSDASRFIAHINIAKPLMYERHFDDTITHLQAALKIRPNDPVGIGEMAAAYGKKGLHERALELANRSLAIDPSLDISRLARVAALFYLGKRNVAIKELSDLIRERPNDAALRIERAQMYTEERQEELAHADLSQVRLLMSAVPDIKTLKKGLLER